METKNIIYELRKKRGMSQDELAEKVMVTRQAVSRWENGETVPNTDTLKLLSKEFGVSINTLLGTPRKLVCQCCGMPLEDEIIGRDRDGALNEEYCKWCYADGTYTYSDMDDLIDVCVKHMVREDFSEDRARSYMKELLPTLNYWKRYEELSDNGQFEAFKKQLIEEINELHIEGMPKVEKLDIDYVHPVTEHSWGQRVVRIYDPDQHIIEVGENMKAVCRRFLESGMTPEQVAQRMDVPAKFVKACMR